MQPGYRRSKMISIIVPVYQSEKTLERCVRSLLAQSFAEIEVLLVLDGATDRSGEIAGKLTGEDERIRVLSQENQGVSAARNAGIDAAKGDYILFVDSDDYVAPDLCEKMWLAIAENNADLAVCGFHHLYFGRDVVKEPKAGVFLVRKDKEELLSLYETQFLNMPWNKLFRREMIQNRYRTDMELGEDLLFNMAYLEQCRSVVVLPEPLVYYVQDERGTTLSTKKRENRMENALYLYRQMQEGCERLYGSTDTGGVLENRLTEEFLDEIESLGVISNMSVRDKLAVIRKYYDGYAQIENKNDISVGLPDYKIIQYFWERKCFLMTWILVELRGMLVKLRRYCDRHGR